MMLTFAIPTAGAGEPTAGAAEAAGRVTSRRTLLNADGHVLRGTKLVIGKALPKQTEFTLSEDSWAEVRRLGLNTVRLCMIDPWYRTRGYDHWETAELLPKIDRAVDLAEEAGVEVIINYQDVGGYEENRRDFTSLAEFWSAVGPRYADRSHVIYELVNEPAFNQAVYLDPTFKRPVSKIYRRLRTDAPERPVLMFSFNSIDHELTRIVDHYCDDLDWERTTVAFHLYGGTSTEPVRRLLDRYPAMCTELDYPGTHPYVHLLDGRRLSVRNCEDLGVSWIDWSNWDDTTFDPITETLLPDAWAGGYLWPHGGGPPANRRPPPIVDFSGDTSLVDFVSSRTVRRPSDAWAEIDWQDPDDDRTASRWRIERTVDGRYRIADGSTGMQLTAGEHAGDPVKLAPPNDGWLSQRWRLEPVWESTQPSEVTDPDPRMIAVRLRSDWTGRCLCGGADRKAPVMGEADMTHRDAWWRTDSVGKSSKFENRP